MTELDYIVLFVAGFIVTCVAVMIFGKGSPPQQPDPNHKDEVAIELLRGADVKELARREGKSAEEITAWKDEFLKDALDFAKNKNEYKKRRAECEHEIKWFEDVCSRFIGEDWKQKTGYDKRNR
ncbi:MAG: hypothetical protein IJ874_00925 [Ruminococcus sp.]|nr:hypothetical protein [Ruminococcus sp.]